MGAGVTSGTVIGVGAAVGAVLEPAAFEAAASEGDGVGFDVELLRAPDVSTKGACTGGKPDGRVDVALIVELDTAACNVQQHDAEKTFFMEYCARRYNAGCFPRGHG